MGDYRAAYRIYTAANGDRRQLEVVSGKAYSAAQHPYLTYIRTPDHHPRSPAARWCLSDPEMKRRRRVAGYKIYTMEGKVKASLRKGLRWIKGKCSELVHGR
ncbi:hypothetical protein AXF42_Ash013889 [Apostasia shenzhenica]|uniref:DUF3511 domain-containing protein n=1 Tax=Apostasia shenzhenica TaxID=1088818 RepID=A0A2I0AS55_9ASPA|nr:hypothetical protein AXF42_Ash013889 [Apostasia shenzhenica]